MQLRYVCSLKELKNLSFSTFPYSSQKHCICKRQSSLTLYCVLTAYNGTNCEQHKIGGNHNSSIKWLHGSVKESEGKQNLLEFHYFKVTNQMKSVNSLQGKLN